MCVATLDNIERLLDQEKWSDARKAIRAELARQPDSHILMAWQAALPAETGRVRESLRLFKRLLKQAPGCPHLLWFYAETLDLANKEKQAIDLWKELLRKGPARIAKCDCSKGVHWAKSFLNDCRYRIGLCYDELGKTTRALRYIRSHLSGRRRGLDSAYSIRDVKKKVSAILSQRKSEERKIRITTYLDREEWRKARTLLVKELKQDKENHWLLTQLSSTYYEERRYKKALAAIETARRIAPHCPLVLWHHAGTLESLGKSAEAIDVWKRLLKRGPKSVGGGVCGEGIAWARSLLNDIRYRLGLAFEQAGDRKRAIRYLRGHIANRERGVTSIYPLRDARKHLGGLITSSPD